MSFYLSYERLECLLLEEYGQDLLGDLLTVLDDDGSVV
jgi:hypothetical protein